MRNTALILFAALSLMGATHPSPSNVALTFDDGPDPRYTQTILDILARYEVKATFFVLGGSAKAYPELIKAIKAGGHVIANHTYTHANLKRLGAASITSEIRKTNDAIEAIVGSKPKCIRPPYGASSKLVHSLADQEGLKVVMWDLNSFDYEGKAPAVVSAWVLANAKAGADILMHDSGRGGDRTSKALPSIIEGYKKRGVGFDVICD